MNKFQEVFLEFEKHLMEDDKPSNYFNEIIDKELFFKESPFILLDDLVKIEQSPKYHPEGNVWNHIMLVVDNAAIRKGKSKEPRVLMWSALLHDLGKGPTTKLRKGKITSYDHDKVGETLSIQFLEEFTTDIEFINKVSKMVRWHMQTLFIVKGMPFADMKKMISEVPIDEIALLTLCDRLGRGDMTEEKIKEEKENVDYFLKKCYEFLEKQRLSK